MIRTCNASELDALIQKTPDGSVCRLEPKEYYLTRRLEILGRRHLTIDGNGATLITRYENVMPAVACTDAFYLENCDHVTLKNLTITTDTPINMTAVVESYDETAGAFVLKVDDCYAVTGREVLLAMTSFDAEGSPDRRFASFLRNPDPTAIKVLHNEIICFANHIGPTYEYLGGNRFRMRVSDLEFAFPPQIAPGLRLCIRHTMYGPSVITLRDSSNTCLQDITLPAVPGFGVTVLTRCHNLTIDGLHLPLLDPEHTLMASNCDGIHIVGLTGKLIMKNCLFDGLGDDALNVHSTAGTVTAIAPDRPVFKCNYCKKTPDGVLPAHWCAEGDLLRFFEPETQQVTATAVVCAFEDGYVTYRDLQGEPSVGDMVQNVAFTPACEIENCVVRNSRARGFLIQTENVEIKNCSFFGIAGSPIKAAPAFVRWYEVGPCKHLCIHDNDFEKWGEGNLKTPAVAVYTRHSGNDETITGLHRDIRITDNRFSRKSGLCIEVSSADQVVVTGNRFFGREDPAAPAVGTINCRDVRIEGNQDVR